MVRQADKWFMKEAHKGKDNNELQSVSECVGYTDYFTQELQGPSMSLDTDTDTDKDGKLSF